MDAKGYLQEVGAQVNADFVKNRSILSFEEYLALFFNDPKAQARNAAQYLRDVMDHFGTETASHPTGTIRRFKVFDAPGGDKGDREAGQEEVQNAIYRLLGNFVRAGRINKLILLHGPNGSAKSTLVNALKEGMEAYSRLPQGALYRIAWVFPSEKLIKGSIGFGERDSGQEEVASFAHLEAESIDLRMPCELRDHPLFAVPPGERRKLLESALKKKGLGNGDGETGDFILSDYVRDGELCSKCRRIYTALLNSYGGDWLKVMRHVQVERFYVSRRYQVGTVTVEPQMSVDAMVQQITADRTQLNVPAPLHSTVLFEPHGPLVHANRGLIEYADLLKRPLEAFKYLLGFSETGEVPLEPFVLQLDEVLIASANEKHLGAFKELPDFASFKGRIELVRVPYLRRYKLDELPNLACVLIGQMSIVGPRPEVPQYTSLYRGEEALILTMRPGITDYSSVRFIDLASHIGSEDVDANFESRVLPVKNRLRVRYVKEWSFRNDMRIIGSTLLALVARPRR